MPLDFTNQLDIPEAIDFNISVEPTEVAHKKLVRNADTGVAIDYIGTDQSHHMVNFSMECGLR